MDTLVLDFTDKYNRIVSKLTSQLILGMEIAGASPKIIYLDDLDISSCKGCTEDINFVSNGDCLCQDDFRLLYPLIRRSENLIFVLDIYKKSIWETLVSSMNRMEPLYEFPLNNEHKNSSKYIYALIYSAGGRNSAVDLLINEIENFAILIGGKYCGYLYRPDYDALNMLSDEFLDSFKYLGVFREAGMSIIKSKSLDGETVNKVGEKIFEDDSFLNEVFQNIYDRFR